MYIFDKLTTQLVEAEIVEGKLKDMPLKKDGWNFNWRKTLKAKNSKTYVLRLKVNPTSPQGVLQLRTESGMITMELIEISPDNLGKTKRYDYVAGCLIAFACQQTFKLTSSYKGFLSFDSKTKLITWYQKKYYAKIAVGQKMYIDAKGAKRLIEQYLKRNKD